LFPAFAHMQKRENIDSGLAVPLRDGAVRYFTGTRLADEIRQLPGDTWPGVKLTYYLRTERREREDDSSD